MNNPANNNPNSVSKISYTDLIHQEVGKTPQEELSLSEWVQGTVSVYLNDTLQGQALSLLARGIGSLGGCNQDYGLYNSIGCKIVDDTCPDGSSPENWFPDVDEDTYGLFGSEGYECYQACEKPNDKQVEYVNNTEDCVDDPNANGDQINARNEEICNDGVDNDCSGQEDDNAVDALTWYENQDDDYYGNPDVTTEACDEPEGYESNGADCDDTDPNIGLSSTWYADNDGDGYGTLDGPTEEACTQPASYAATYDDCDDTDPSLNPANPDGCGVPAPTFPSDTTTLAPTRAFLSWDDTPWAGKTIEAYEVCYADSALSASGECLLNITSATGTVNRSAVIDTLQKNEYYEWQVRTHYTDGTISAFSGLQTFMTDDSVVAWLRFDEGSGSTANDSSGNGYYGVLENSAAFSSADGIDGALQLNNDIDYVNLDPDGDYDLGTLAFDSTADQTIEVWFKPATSTSTGVIFNLLASGGSAPGVQLFAGAGLLADILDARAGQDSSSCGYTNCVYVEDSSDVYDGQFHQGAWLYNGASPSDLSVGTLMVDGNTSGSASDNFSFSKEDFQRATVGDANHDTVGGALPGLIDEVIIYNNALASHVVLNNYCAVKSLEAENTGDALPALCP